MRVEAYSIRGMKAHPKSGERVSARTFTREQVAAQDWRVFVAAYEVNQALPEMLRESFDSLVIRFSGFEDDPRGLYENPETRDFVRTLHEQWPYGLFFLHLSSADVKSYVYCRLATLGVERRSGGGAPKLVFSRNELFQIIGRDLKSVEKACQRAEFTPDVFRNRARRILKLFGFLK